jgi:hypothetical protein
VANCPFQINYDIDRRLLCIPATLIILGGWLGQGWNRFGGLICGVGGETADKSGFSTFERLGCFFQVQVVQSALGVEVCQQFNPLFESKSVAVLYTLDGLALILSQMALV